VGREDSGRPQVIGRSVTASRAQQPIFDPRPVRVTSGILGQTRIREYVGS
jgi:hypothetical protein